MAKLESVQISAGRPDAFRTLGESCRFNLGNFMVILVYWATESEAAYLLFRRKNWILTERITYESRKTRNLHSAERDRECSALSGCSHVEEVYEKTVDYMETTTRRFQRDSKWVNSDLWGVVKKRAVVSEKMILRQQPQHWILSVADQVEKIRWKHICCEDNYDVVVQQKQALLNTAIAGNGFAEKQSRNGSVRL